MINKLIFTKDEFNRLTQNSVLKSFMTTEEQSIFSGIVRDLEKEMIFSTKKDLPHLYRKIRVGRNNYFLREPFIFKVGSIPEITFLKCVFTGNKISKGEDCILFVLRVGHNYHIKAAIKDKINFDFVLRKRSIYEAYDEHILLKKEGLVPNQS